MDPRRGVGSDRFLQVVGGLVVAMAVVIGVVRYAGGMAQEPRPERVLSAVALAAVLAAPGLMALLALAGRPALLVPAGCLLLPLAFLSFAGVTLPLLIPAALLLVAYGRRSGEPAAPRPMVPVAFTTVLVIGFVVSAVVALFAHPDPRSYTSATGGSSTSDVVTAVESLASLFLAAAAVVGAWVLSGPPPPPGRPDDLAE